MLVLLGMESWAVPMAKAQCGSAYDPIGAVGNELTDTSSHINFRLVLTVIPGRTKQKPLISALNMNLAGLTCLK